MFNENTWKFGENLAKNYLIKNGYNVLYTNFSCVNVELDIVSICPVKTQKLKLKQEFNDKISQISSKLEKKVLNESYKNLCKTLSDILVITEVKSRATDKFGLGVEAISENKIKNIKKGARYLLTKEQFKNMQIRFDVASIDGNEVLYIENAFV